MSHYVARIYSGSDDRSPEQLCEMAFTELLPKLQEGLGLVYYATIILDDGRVGSTSLYETLESAQKGQEIARQWVGQTAAMQHCRLVRLFQGEVARIFEGSGLAAYWFGRIYPTTATARRVADACASDALPTSGPSPGHVQNIFVQLPAGHVGAFTMFDSKDSAERISAEIRRQRTVTALRTEQVTPNTPERLGGYISSTWTK